MVDSAVIEQEAQGANKAKARKSGPQSGSGDGASSKADKLDSKRANQMVESYSLPAGYKILTDSPLTHLNSSIAKAFEVNNAKQRSDIYALILPNNLPIRFEVIQKLKSFFHNSFCNIVDTGFTEAADGKFGNYAIIAEKPKGRSLGDYIEELKETKLANDKKMGFLDDEFLARDVVEPINEILKSFSENDVSHGVINHNTIFLESLELTKSRLTISQPVSEPCGLSQYGQYEPINRAQSMPLGKGETTIQNDYFALGVLVFYTLYGQLPGRGAEQSDFINQRLVKGSYNTYLDGHDVPARVVDLLRGLLNDNTEERWGHSQVESWIKGKRFNLIKPIMRKESVRDYEFFSNGFRNRRSLANAFFHKWEECAEDIRTKKLSKWMELSLSNTALADEVNGIVNSTGGETSKSRREDDELVSRALIALDPISPIRLKEMSCHVGGLGAVLANAWAHQNQVELQTFTDILKFNLAEIKVQRDVDTESGVDRWLLQKLNSFIGMRSYGFGIERCLYDLNPYLPCQSSLLKQAFIMDNKQLLYFLNDNAAKLENFDPIDRHIAAFITSKLDMAQELNPTYIRRFREKTAKDFLSKIALLSYAQQRSNLSRLSGLSNWVLTKLDFITQSLNGKKNRKQFQKELEQAAKTGSLQSMLDVVSGSSYFTMDKEHFSAARNEYKILNRDLKLLTDPKQRQGRALINYHNGLYLAKVLGVIVFIVVMSLVAT